MKVVFVDGKVSDVSSVFFFFNIPYVAGAVGVCMVRRPLASKIFVEGGLKCIRPVIGAKLLAMVESAHRRSMKWVELESVLIPTQA